MSSIITNTNHLILLQAAKDLGISSAVLSTDPIKICYSYQGKTHLITQKSLGLNISKQALNISKNKSLTLKALQAANLPVPRHTVINDPQAYPQACQTIPFPQVIKPLCGQKGKNVFLKIKNLSQGQKIINRIFSRYQTHSTSSDQPGALVETYQPGSDYRFLVLNFKLIGLVKRLPPTITGNGHSTIRQLIEKENQRRHQLTLKTGHRLLNRIRNWTRLDLHLHLQKLSLNSILPQAKTITLSPVPNFSTGGSVTAIDPKTIHPSLVKLAEKAAKTIGLQVCGLDMIINQPLSQPASPNTCHIIEINSDPGLRLHHWPNQGTPQPVAKKIFTSIFQL